MFDEYENNSVQMVDKLVILEKRYTRLVRLYTLFVIVMIMLFSFELGSILHHKHIKDDKSCNCLSNHAISSVESFTDNINV